MEQGHNMHTHPKNTMVDNTTPQDRLATAVAAFFRSLSGSSDRQMAGVAFELEKPVLELIRRPKTKTKTSPLRQ